MLFYYLFNLILMPYDKLVEIMYPSLYHPVSIMTEQEIGSRTRMDGWMGGWDLMNGSRKENWVLFEIDLLCY